MTRSTPRRLLRSLSALLGATLLCAGGAEAQSVTWSGAPTVISTGTSAAARADPRLAFNHAQICGHGPQRSLWTFGTVASAVITYNPAVLSVEPTARDRMVHAWIEKVGGDEVHGRVTLRSTVDHGLHWTQPVALTTTTQHLANLSPATWMRGDDALSGACWDVKAGVGRSDCAAGPWSSMLGATPPAAVSLPWGLMNPSIAGFDAEVVVAADNHDEDPSNPGSASV